MFCDKCGKENLETSRFCENCGNQLIKTEIVPPVNESQVNTVTETPATPTNEAKKGINKKTLKIIIGSAIGVVALTCILVVVLIVVFVKASNPTIKLDDYVMIEESGYDGYGKATVRVDWDAVEEKYGDKLSYTRQAKKEYSDILKYVEPIDFLKTCVSVKLDENTGLSNGDDIEYTWVLNVDIDEYFKNTIKTKDGEYLVKDLTEVGSFDPFKDLTVSVEGISSNAYLKYEYTGNKIGYYDFRFSESTGLSNGDVIIITIDDSNPEYYVNMYGMLPEKYTMEYKVTGLDEYVNSYSDISKEYIDDLKSEVEDKIYSYVANSYSAESKLSDLKYVGYIFNCVDDKDEYYYNYNNLYIIYSGSVSNSKDKFKTTTVYYPVSFSSILSGEEGFSFGSSDGIIGSTYFDDSSYSTKGYTNSLNCYLEIISRNSDNYKFELGGEFEKYDEYEIVSELDDISDKYKNTLTEDAKKIIEEYVKEEYEESSVISGLKYVGDYLLVAKEQGADYKNNNRYVMVFSATLSSTEDKFEKTTVYYPVEYDGLVKITDGKYTYGKAKGILGKTYFSEGRFYTMGYIDGEKMYSDIVSANREKFKYEVSEKLEKFGE